MWVLPHDNPNRTGIEVKSKKSKKSKKSIQEMMRGDNIAEAVIARRIQEVEDELSHAQRSAASFTKNAKRLETQRVDLYAALEKMQKGQA